MELRSRAIARVHRIGQHLPTTVWMYIVEDTVEKSIYDISVTRRMELMGRHEDKTERSEEASLENQIDAANTMELEQTALGKVLAKGSSGGEVVGKEDLWDCLFQNRPGHTRSPRAAGREMGRGLEGTAGEGQLDFEGQPGNSV